MSVENILTSPVVNGEHLALSSEKDPMHVVNPATGSRLCSVPDVGEEGVDAAVRAAANAFEGWALTPPRQRSEALFRFAAALEDRASEIARLETLDVGKPSWQSEYEVASALDKVRFFAGACRTLSGPLPYEYKVDVTSLLRREPRGVVAGITPWNYPFGMTAWKVSPALAAGNTVVLKPSPHAPLSTLLVGEIAAETLPRGVVNVITGPGPGTGEALVRHRGIALVSLTGDTATGRAVMRAAADGLKRLHLELGGKAAFVVFDDADPDTVAEAMVAAAFLNAGQACDAASRLYVHESIADTVSARVVEVAAGLAVGDPTDPATRMGPLISAQHRERVEGFVDRATASGHVDLLLGGGAIEEAGFFYRPTILAGTLPEDEIVQREVFGPVITVMTFRSEREALAHANGVDYGLASSVWTNDLDSAIRMSRALRFGTVWINDHGSSTTEMPFGGFGSSGIGRDLSLLALEEHTEVKHVALRTRPLDAPDHT